ncbi:hypothetical protein Pcinc_033449, partial [Petrolisthes cinctipes]
HTTPSHTSPSPPTSLSLTYLSTPPLHLPHSPSHTSQLHPTTLSLTYLSPTSLSLTYLSTPPLHLTLSLPLPLSTSLSFTYLSTPPPPPHSQSAPPSLHLTLFHIPLNSTPPLTLSLPLPLSTSLSPHIPLNSTPPPHSQFAPPSLHLTLPHIPLYSTPPPHSQDWTLIKGHCTSSTSVSCPTLPPATPKCFNQSDGFYPDFDHQCTRYFRCVNGSVGGEWQCTEGSLWDTSTGSCGKGPRLVCMAQSCQGLSDGAHPTPTTSCTSYYICTDGVRTDHVCPYNTIFDYTIKRCVSSSNSVCYERVCEGRVNGLHAAPHAPCNTYFRCFNGALVSLKTCPKPHQIFDGRKTRV